MGMGVPAKPTAIVAAGCYLLPKSPHTDMPSFLRSDFLPPSLASSTTEPSRPAKTG